MKGHERYDHDLLAEYPVEDSTDLPIYWWSCSTERKGWDKSKEKAQQWQPIANKRKTEPKEGYNGPSNASTEIFLDQPVEVADVCWLKKQSRSHKLVVSLESLTISKIDYAV